MLTLPKTRLRGLKKRDLLAISFILILTFSIILLQGPIASSIFTRANLIETDNEISAVPFYILYQPPGSGSNSHFSSEEIGVVNLQFESNSEDILVAGEYSTSIGLFTAATPWNLNDSAVLVMVLNQTWEVWHYTYFAEEWNEAHLTSCSLLGIGGYGFQELDEQDIWMIDRSHSSSDYSLEWNIESGESESVTIECKGLIPQMLGAGFFTTFIGNRISINVTVTLQGAPFSISYNFNDPAESLSIQLYSETPISQSPYSTDGITLWFS
ncbi:MAG: hypothetical protein ACFFF4_17870 [Candidatus Thorarchaeota archaeon]